MTYRASKYRIMSILLVFAMTIGAFTGFSYISAGEEQVTILYEEESKRTENEKHYLCSDGSYVALSYPGAVHYKAEDGSYQEIENALVYDEKTGTYQNPGNPDFSVSLATTENTDAVSVKAKELEEISFSTALLINGNGNSPKPQKKNIKAFNNMAKNAAGKNAKNPTVFDLPQVSSSLEYAKYYGDQPVVTGKYTLGGNALKEDIILTVPTDVTGLVTTYKVKNMTLTVNPDGSLLFKTADGKDAYTVNAPYMYDAEGSRCPSIAVSAVQKGNKFEVTYLPDSAWLTSAERVYPLTFDPTITTTSFAFSCDDRYYAGGVAYDSQELRVGYSFTGQSNFWYTYFKPLSYPEINQDYYTVTTVLMSFSMLTVAGSSPYANVYKLNSGADPADLNISEDGTYMGYMEMWEGNRGDFSLGTSYYTDNTLSEYVLWPQNTTTSYGYCYFGSMEHTTNRPMMRISYRPKALEGKFVLKNGTNYLLSNGGSATAPALQFKSAFDESDFYYCEWTFGYNETKRAYTISPAYDPQLCLQANSDNTATLVVAPATLTNNHFWYIDTDADESYLKIKSVGQSGNNLCITNNMALHSPSED